MPDHDRARGRRLCRDPLQPARAAHPVRRQLADLLCHVRHHGRDGVVVASLDPHDARRLRCPEPHREHRPEHDRHLSEDIARVTLAEDALDPVDEPDRLDATLEHGEQRALSALVRRVLARHEADIRRHSGRAARARPGREPQRARHHRSPRPSPRLALPSRHRGCCRAPHRAARAGVCLHGHRATLLGLGVARSGWAGQYA